MPRFLRRIFNPTSNPFRSTPPTTEELEEDEAPAAPIQRPRRVLIRSLLDEHSSSPSHWKTALFDAEQPGTSEEHMALRDGGASVAESTELHKPILAQQQQQQQQVDPGLERVQPRTRRRLSKKRRRPA